MKYNIDPSLIAYIDLNAFRNNINYIRELYPNSKIILPVKANAYGHGDIIISKEAEKIGIEYLAVARIEEGINLRQNNIKIPIMNFGVEFGNNIKTAIEYNIELSVSSLEHIKEIENNLPYNNKKIPLHLKIDTGMTRLGCLYEEAEFLSEYILQSNIFTLKSIYSHYARSDEDSDFTSLQTSLFTKFQNKLDKKGISPEFYHLSNSGAIISPPKNNIINGIRPGIMSYGYSPSTVYIDKLQPVMTLKSKVIHIKKVPKNTGVSYSHIYKTDKTEILATIPLGYGDGFPRALSNNFKVTIKNNNYYQVGRISMDLSVIKADENVHLKDEVIIFGNKNICCNNANDLARKCNTISYEITTSLTSRVKRIAVN